MVFVLKRGIFQDIYQNKAKKAQNISFLNWIRDPES